MMRLLLVDGHYYLYRSYFAIRGLKNSRGEPTNAIYGFVKALRKMLLDLKPDLAAVIWDAGLPERRTTLQPAYKQHRDEMPNDLDLQQEPLRQVIPHLGVKNILLPNTEADDLIASYVVAAQKQEIELDQREVEWVQTQLEVTTFSEQNRVELVAREKLKLVLPLHEKIIYIKP